MLKKLLLVPLLMSSSILEGIKVCIAPIMGLYDAAGLLWPEMYV